MRFQAGLWSAKLFVLAAVGHFLATPAHAQAPRDAAPAPVIKSALDGIFDGFATHPLVGFGEKHNLAELMDFYQDVVSDPRFAREVGNVVVEFGGAARQDVIDRYVNGESVPYTELRSVWADTVGWIPTVTGVGYAQFFARVRDVNLKLSPEQRIRVWLGEPPIDWTKIETREDWLALARQRDAHAAEVISRNVLARREKALVIYGAGHFHHMTAQERALYAEWAQVDAQAAEASLNVQELIENEHPDAFFIVGVYIGFADEDCTQRFEPRLREWRMPALAAPMWGTTLERDLRACMPRVPRTGTPSFPPTMPQALRDFVMANPSAPALLDSDAVLFLGPAASLTVAPMMSDLYLDEDYRREIGRRAQIMNGAPLAADYGRNQRVTAATWTQREGPPATALRKEIALPPETLPQYVGTYEVRPGFNVVVTLEDGRLHTQATGQPKVAMYSEALDRFFLRVADVDVEFVRNDLGGIVEMIMHAPNQDIRAERQ